MKQMNSVLMDAIVPRSHLSLSERYRFIIVKRIVLLLLLLACLFISFLLAVGTGPAGLSIGTVLTGLVSPEDLSPALGVIIWDVRLPVAAMAVIVGACLGLAGGEMQTVLNNPLASPSTLGISYAATLGASLAIAFDLAAPMGTTIEYIVPVFAFLGAIASMVFILTLSRLYGATLEVVILIGIALVFALQALISLIQFIADSESLQQIVFWMMGSLVRANWEKLSIVSVAFAVCAVWSALDVWKLTVLRGGEAFARSAGIAVERVRIVTLIRVSLLAAVAVSFTGVIGFVGLVAPHIARLIIGEDHRFYLPASAITGALVLCGASIAAKTLVPGILIPDGIVTALIGVPLLLVLVLIQRRQGH